MATVTEFIVSVVELVEAQSDDIRYSFERSAKAIIIFALGTVLCGIGLVYLFLGIHAVVVHFLDQTWGYFISAIIGIIFGLITFKVASWISK